MPQLISIEGFAEHLKLDVKKAKSILRANPEIGVKVPGMRSKMIDLTYWDKVTNKVLGKR